MAIGNKIVSLRKKYSYTQEKLANKVGVSRQTLSNWESDLTSPDLTQAKILSELFKISLDELCDNDIKDIMQEKISNTERLAGLTIKILKVMGILFVILLIIDIISFIFFNITNINVR